MRSGKFLFGLGMAVLIGTGLIMFGCSGDDDNATGNTGSLNDPEFLQIHGEVSDFIDSTLAWFHDGFGSPYTLAADSGIDRPVYGPTDPNVYTDHYEETYANGWFVVTHEFHGDTYQGALLDSVQFLKNGEPQEDPVDPQNIVFKRHWEYTDTDTTVTSKVQAGHYSITFSGLDTDQATVTGDNAWTSVWKEVTVENTVRRQFAINSSLNNFKIDKTPVGWGQSCPCSGTALVDIEMVQQVDDGEPEVTNWSVTISFNSGVANTTVSSDNTTWVYSTQECFAPDN